MTANLPLALAGVVSIGMACQWLAWRMRLPAILLLLTAGLLFGPGLEAFGHFGPFHGRLLDPDRLLGDLLLPVVSLSVALILFEGGLTLDAEQLKHGGVVVRLVSIGTMVSWALATAGASWILSFPPGLAVLLGAILVVTGPTVIGPLLRFVRPTGPVAPILRWEGILIDPIGAMLAVIVFEAVVGGDASAGGIAGAVLKIVGIGAACGLAGAALLVVLLRRGGAADHLHNPLAVAAVLLTFAGSNALQPESGLVAVTVMGIGMAQQRRVAIEHVLDFKESLSVLLVSSLFVLLGSRLTLEQLRTLDWRVVGYIAALVIIVRPAAVGLATLRSGLTWRERLFLALMAPRGIVAASVASVFALQLAQRHYPDANRFAPATFAVVCGTVLVYGLGAPAVSRWLGLTRPGQSGLLIAGADALARGVAEAVGREGYEVALVDSNAANVSAARLAGLTVIHGNAMSREVGNAIALSSIGRLLAMTPNAGVNELAAMKYLRQFGRDNVYVLTRPPRTAGRRLAHETAGLELFGAGVSHRELAERLARGATIKTTKLSSEFDFAAYRMMYRSRAMVMFLIDAKHALHVITSEDVLTPQPGETVIALVTPGANE